MHVLQTKKCIIKTVYVQCSLSFVCLALKGDRKRLKAEKFELLSQMKQLYATLEDKEKELRDFIRNYEQVRRKKTIKRWIIIG